MLKLPPLCDAKSQQDTDRGRSDRGERTSRRAMLTGAAMLAFWTQADARAQVARPAAKQSMLRWLVNHITMGFTEAELALAQSLGYNGYLDYQLNYEAIDDSQLEAALSVYTTLTMQPYELYQLQPGAVVRELREAAVLRAVFSRRQLHERMVEFWTDHLNIDINDGDARFLKTVDDRDVIRPHALGAFPDLLHASAHSPAMLYYLDNFTSAAGNPNENYARELLELHTLGVDGGYTQQDVEEVARCFTGWGLYGRGAGQLTGTFRYNNNLHDNGAKHVLGYDIPAGGGYNDGLIVLDILADHPSTAQFVARKMTHWLLRYDPPQALVDSVAATYTATSGDIRAMVRTIFNNYAVGSAAPKYKRPFHLMASALRATSATMTNPRGLFGYLAATGQLPYNWSSPDGYPDSLDHWVGLILPRWSFGASLLAGQINGNAVDINALLGSANTADAVVDRIDTALFGGEMPPADKDRIREYLLPDPPTVTRKREAVGLAIGSPGFQWY